MPGTIDPATLMALGLGAIMALSFVFVAGLVTGPGGPALSAPPRLQSAARSAPPPQRLDRLNRELALAARQRDADAGPLC